MNIKESFTAGGLSVSICGSNTERIFYLLSSPMGDGPSLPEQLPELKALLEAMKKQVRECYNTDTVCFEHGSVSCTNRFGGCINHAHIHIVPCRNSLIDEIGLYELQTQQIGSVADLQAYGQRCEPYLYFQDTDDREYLITGDNVVSQFFRKLLAQQHDVAEKWDWRSDLCMDNIQKTCQRLGKEA